MASRWRGSPGDGRDDGAWGGSGRRSSFRVLVRAGSDPLTGKDTYLTEFTRDRRQVEKVRTPLLAKVDQQRTGSTKVTLGYTLDAWLQVHQADGRMLEVGRFKTQAEAVQEGWAQVRASKPGQSLVRRQGEIEHELTYQSNGISSSMCVASPCRVGDPACGTAAGRARPTTMPWAPRSAFHDLQHVGTAGNWSPGHRHLLDA